MLHTIKYIYTLDIEIMFLFGVWFQRKKLKNQSSMNMNVWHDVFYRCLMTK